jgi:hypothetical protein
VTSGGVVENAYDEASRTATRNVELDAKPQQRVRRREIDE